MKPRARRGCAQAARQADPATRSECAYPARDDAERAAREIPREYIGLVAPPRTKRGIGARATSAAHPSLAPPAEDQKHSNETPRNGKICALCMIRGIRAAKRAPSWQDLRAMHSRKAICGAFRMHGAHILPKPAHFGYMAAIYCHRWPPGTHHGEIPPRQGTQERIAREYRHCQSLESAFRDDLAITSLLRTHRGEVLPSTSPRECAMATSCRGRPLRECISVTYRQERPRLPGLAAADVGSTQGKRAAARITAKQATHRLEMEPCDPPRDLT